MHKSYKTAYKMNTATAVKRVKRAHRSLVPYLIVFGVLIGVRVFAAPTYHAEMPQDALTLKDARSSETPVFKCSKAKGGGNGGPVKAKGDTKFFKSVGTALDGKAATQMMNDKKIFVKCQAVTWDTDRLKFVNEETEE